jgi:hypothetical protein
MRRAVLTIALLAALMLLPAASSMAKQGRARSIAASTCAQERKTVGQETFAAKYLEPAMPTCKVFMTELARNASQQCRAERKELGSDVFRNRWATRRTRRNAFGKCVSSKVKRAARVTCPGDLEDEDDLGDEELGDEADDLVDERVAHASQFASCDDEDLDDEDLDDEADLGDDDPAEDLDDLGDE